jgi:Type II secretion system protein B
MSYILDALERSEHERKQGELPSFRQDQNLLYMRRERKSPWLVLLVLVLLLNAMVFLYIHFSGATDDVNLPVAGAVDLSKDSSEKTAAQSISSVRSVDLEDAAQLNSAASSEASLPAKRINIEEAASRTATLVEPKLVSESAVIPSTIPSTQKEQTLDVSSAEPLPASDDQYDPEPVVAALELVAPEKEPSEDQFELIEPKSKRLFQSDSVTGSSESNVRAVVSDISLDEISPNSLETANVSAQDKGSSAADPYADVRFLEELDQRTRPKISKLTFNSHIYSSAPSARRVMINNIYLREGQAFQGMTLLSIGEQYVVLEKDGQQFKIAAMRDWMG